jgi:hypothetical protein
VAGSTDMPLRGIVFATEGVNDFMTSVMNIDDQDLISKMEGFAIKGMWGEFIAIAIFLPSDTYIIWAGAAHNYKDRCSAEWSSIRREINCALRTFFF